MSSATSQAPRPKEPSALNILMRYAGPYKYLTWLSWVLSAVSSALGLIPFVCIFRILREIMEAAPHFENAASMERFGAQAVGAALLSMLVYFAALMCSHKAAFRVASNLRRALMTHITRMPIGYVDEQGSGRLRRIADESAAATETYLAHQLPDTAAVVVTPLAMIVLLFVFDWRFGLVSLIPVLLSFAVMSRMMGPQMAEDMRQYQNALEEMNRQAVEYIRGISVVKTFSQTVYSFSRFKASIDSYYHFCINYTRLCRAPMVYFQIAVNSAFAFLIALSLVLARSGNLADITVNLIFYVIFTPMIATAFTRMMYMGEESMAVQDAVKRMDGVLHAVPLPEPEHPLHPADASVVFENVTFRYRPDAAPAVDSVSLRIPAGSTIALVGASGSGKSTAAGLAARFWDAEEGRILIGGVDVRRIAKEERVRTVSYVFQDSRLLKRTIADNVRLGRPDATDAEVLAALRDAQCGDLLDKLPDGMNTVIGTKGIYLSGGEQQRIAIARAMLQNAPILILDEATAFADPENEVLVQRALERLAARKTVILIAHRLTTVQNADCIYVLEQGRVAEQGTHAALLARDGLYRRMWQDYQSSIVWKVGERK